MSEPSELSSIAHPLRIRILHELQRKQSSLSPDPVSFSTLQSLVNEPDNGRFNYHLQKLTGQYIRASANGYWLTMAGFRAISALMSGTFESRSEDRSFSLDDQCPVHQENLHYQHSGNMAVVSCLEHDLAKMYVPASAAAEMNDQALVYASDQFARIHWNLAWAGFCEFCRGPVETQFVPRAGLDVLPAGDGPAAKFTCRNCGYMSVSSAGTGLLNHPKVVSFFNSNDIDLQAQRHWTLPFVAGKGHTTVVDRDPWCVVVEIEANNETLRMVIDENLSVTQL